MIDRNDNPPIFMNSTFEFTITEGLASHINYTLLVSDADFGENADLIFTKQGLSCDYLRLHPKEIRPHVVSSPCFVNAFFPRLSMIAPYKVT